MRIGCFPVWVIWLSMPLASQIQGQSSSTFAYYTKDGEQNVEITNVSYQVTRVYPAAEPAGHWLVLRTTLHSKEILDEKGWESKIRLEAWPLGAALAGKPAYTLDLPGSEATLLGGELWQVTDEATDPDVPVWSVYRLATGQRLFDSFVQPLSLRVPADAAHQTFEDRFAGFYVPPDDAPDPRLRDKHAVGVLSYASAGGVLREALLSCDDAARATVLRSYWDTERSLVFLDSPSAIQIGFKPGPTVGIPASTNDLDLRRAILPRGLHLTVWKR
jgi:hypothetical protein